MNSTALDPTLIADFDFIETKLPAIEGWLEPPAAQLTAFLLREQLSQAIAGPVLEIGVWRGKYLSVMFLCSVGKVIGVDIFQYGNTEEGLSLCVREPYLWWREGLDSVRT